jgi:glycine cleavage system regulatory protein
MLTTLVMTVIGPDRPGLVEMLAARVAENGGNWLESRMCRLGGQFAGIVSVEVETAKSEELTNALRALEAKGLRITSEQESAAIKTKTGNLAVLELVGQDRPGIMHQISRILAAHSVNVEELSTERTSAPMDGSMLFQARATVSLPTNVSLSMLRADLEKIAADLMVDVDLNPSAN